MKRVEYSRPGDPAQVLRVAEAAEPGAPLRGQILVRVSEFSVHPGDLAAIAAPFPGGAGKPAVPGLEATGTVEAIGPGTQAGPGVVTGARVTLFLVPGAWQDLVLAPAELVVAVPDGVPDGVAAQLVINPMTSLLLRQAAERTGAVGYNGLAVQTAAGSTVGRLLASQFTRRAAGLVNIVRSEAGADRLRQQFPDVPVITTERADWREQVTAAAGGRPISAVLDPVSGAIAGDLLTLLSPGGSLITYGSLAPEPMSVHATALLPKGLSITSVTIGGWAASTSRRQRQWDVDAALDVARSALRHLEVAATYALDDIAAAVDHALRPGKAGLVTVRTR
jgi:NADPH:quinone reductase-like Zn-dependent oxidoreductase